MNYVNDSDEDLGVFSYCPRSDSWFLYLELSDIGKIMIRGDLRRPDLTQKERLNKILPRLNGLTESTRRDLNAPPEKFDAVLPQDLSLRELRLEPNGDVELFFDPGIWAGGAYLTPLSTCDASGKLIKIDWST